MSLEALIAENTVALKACTAALTEANAGRAAAVESITGAVAPKASTKKVDKPAEAAPAHATAVTTTVARPAAAAGPMTIETFRNRLGELVTAAPEPEKAKRKTFLKAVNDHFGVATVVEVPADQYATIIGWFDDMIAGKTVNFSADEGGAPAAAAEEDDGIG
jgi:anti-sigma factor RsiW